jgi:hypothetical protein
MTAPATPPPFPISPRAVAAVVLLAGMVISALGFRDARRIDLERAEAQMTHRSALRHALMREVLGNYEDALHAFASLFTLDTPVSRAEFARAAARLERRLPAVQAFEWVPLVPREKRSEVERDGRRLDPEFGIFEMGGRWPPPAGRGPARSFADLVRASAAG